MKQLDLGILGGGQLARMMVPHCINWNTHLAILDKKGAVASSFCHEFIEGSFQNSDDVQKLEHCKTVTMDLEAVSVSGIKLLEEKGVHVAPSSSVIELIQNKIRQKDFFTQNSLPTAPYKVVEKVSDSLEAGFLKLPEGGYDGKGVTYFDGDLANLPEVFKENILWEEKADIDLEFSVIVARNRFGEIKVYEPTEMAFDAKLNLISYTLYPGRLSPQVTATAKKIAVNLMESLKGEGVLAVEMFLTKSGEVWVNELAPRPHNSGHHTIESTLTGQFENHLRGVLGFPLGDVDCLHKALTFNIIGKGEGASDWSGQDDLMASKGVFFHNYGKSECRDGRKMGHVTIVGDDYDEMIKTYHRIKDIIQVRGR